MFDASNPSPTNSRISTSDLAIGLWTPFTTSPARPIAILTAGQGSYHAVPQSTCVSSVPKSVLIHAIRPYGAITAQPSSPRIWDLRIFGSRLLWPVGYRSGCAHRVHPFQLGREESRLAGVDLPVLAWLGTPGFDQAMATPDDTGEKKRKRKESGIQDRRSQMQYIPLSSEVAGVVYSELEVASLLTNDFHPVRRVKHRCV